MGTYRYSRNVEASLIDWITAKLATAGWSNVRVEKAFAQVSNGALPCALVQQDPEDLQRLEVGGKTNIKYYYINIRLFCKDDGSRLDIKDYLTDCLEDDIDYYTYTITSSGTITAKILTGRIVVLNFLKNEKELTNTENLALEDKFRHIITFRCYIAE
jgi:hypothetical protein